MPTNPVATRKFQVVTLGREEAIAKSWPDGQKHGTKAHQADKMAFDIEVPKGNRNLDAKTMRVNDERYRAYPVRSRQWRKP